MMRKQAPESRVDRSFRFPQRLLTLVAVSVLALVFLAPSAAAAKAPTKAPSDFFGIAFGSGAPLDPLDTVLMKDSKVSTMRMLLSWPVIEPQKGVYHWPDATVKQLASQGIRPLFFIEGSPAWATGSSNNRTPPLKGKAKSAWKGFVKTAVDHYKAGGAFWKANPSLTPKPPKAWQIWNEPNLNKEFPPKPSPTKYAKLVKITEPVIAKADRHAKVLLAGLSGNGKMSTYTFLKKFYRVKGIKSHFDGVAFHPYAPKISELKKRIKLIRKVMKKGHDKGTKLWLTEVGYGSAPKDKFGLNQGNPQAQATMLKNSFKTILKQRKKWKIAQLDWFSWRDPPTPSANPGCSFCPYAGLLSGNHLPKPAMTQYRKFTGAKGPLGSNLASGLLPSP